MSDLHNETAPREVSRPITKGYVDPISGIEIDAEKLHSTKYPLLINYTVRVPKRVIAHADNPKRMIAESLARFFRGAPGEERQRQTRNLRREALQEASRRKRQEMMEQFSAEVDRAFQSNGVLAKEAVAEILNELPLIDPHDDDAWIVDAVVSRIRGEDEPERTPVEEVALDMYVKYVKEHLGLTDEKSSSGDPGIMADELAIRFTHHPPKKGQRHSYEAIREKALQFASMLAELCPESRELSLSMTKLEECVMHANSAIARRS